MLTAILNWLGKHVLYRPEGDLKVITSGGTHLHLSWRLVAIILTLLYLTLYKLLGLAEPEQLLLFVKGII